MIHPTLPTFTLKSPFLLQAKLVARKSRLWRDCVEKASAGKELDPELSPMLRQNAAGSSGAKCHFYDHNGQT